MKISGLLTMDLAVALLLATGLFSSQTARAGEGSGLTNAASQRIGVYDSRAVSFACFWSEGEQQKLKELMNAAEDAKAAGDTTKSARLDAELTARQEASHRQVFSTAPADEAMAALKPRLPAIRNEAGVSELISKWDEEALQQHKSAERVDVTDLLVREFKPTEKQLKTIAEIQKKKPVALKQIDQLDHH